MTRFSSWNLSARCYKPISYNYYKRSNCDCFKPLAWNLAHEMFDKIPEWELVTRTRMLLSTDKLSRRSLGMSTRQHNLVNKRYLVYLFFFGSLQFRLNYMEKSVLKPQLGKYVHKKHLNSNLHGLSRDGARGTIPYRVCYGIALAFRILIVTVLVSYHELA
jgi:hypothetical protein